MSTTLSRTPEEAPLVVTTLTLAHGDTAGFIETVSGKPLELGCVPPSGGRVYFLLPAGRGMLTDPAHVGLCPGTSVMVTAFYAPSPATTTSDTPTAVASSAG